MRTPRIPWPRGRSPIARWVVRVDPAGQEALELLAALVEDAQRGVARAGELAGHLEHAVEHDLEVELGHQGAPDLEEPAQALRVEMLVVVTIAAGGDDTPPSAAGGEAVRRVPARGVDRHANAIGAGADLRGSRRAGADGQVGREVAAGDLARRPPQRDRRAAPTARPRSRVSRACR